VGRWTESGYACTRHRRRDQDYKCSGPAVVWIWMALCLRGRQAMSQFSINVLMSDEADEDIVRFQLDEIGLVHRFA